MDAIWTGAVANTISSVVCAVIAPLVQVVDDIIHLERNTLSLQENLGTAKVFLEGTDTQFHHQQRSIPPALNDGFEGLRHSVDDAESVISSSQQRQGCLDRRFCKPRLCRQIRECNIVLQERYNNLRNAISTVRDIQEVVSSAPLCPEAQLQPVPESGYVGTGIKSAEMQLNTWLEADDHQFRVIGIYGMGGIGKTSLLKAVYNTYKQLKGNVFQVVIWLTVSQKFNILDLQSSITEAINLQLGSTSNAQSSTSNALEARKMKLFARLKEIKFLLILDDTWESIQLEEELGIPVGKDNGSKVVISSRRRDVIRGMGADDRYSIQIQPLSPIEGWQLFCRVAFKAGGAPTKSIENIARKIAEECKGLPLALNVVAAALAGNTTAEEWHLALTQMQKGDPGFLTMYSGIDEHLYGRLKLSYDRLNDCNLQNCFLFCGAFPEDAEIRVETLVEMWIGEGLVHSRDKSQFMSAGRRFVTQLVERCLFQYVETDMKHIKVHDIVRDLALYIAEKEEKCLFRTIQKLDEFPAEEVMDDCKRIAIRYYNDDTDAFLPTDFRCPKLGTLILNQSLREVPNGFFLNLTSLRVLDLSDTNITSLPESLWQLKQLEFLRLNRTDINSLPDDICNLSRLQFLHLAGCRQLKSLPRTMAELKNLKHLDLNGCGSLAGIPREICQLTSLNKLQLQMDRSKLGVDEAESGMCSLKDFTNFPNLMELEVRVEPGKIVDGISSGIKEGTMATWLEMRHLHLGFDLAYHDHLFYMLEKEVVVEDLPRDMQNMKKLQTFHLRYYSGIRLPNCICDFELLEELHLLWCCQLYTLPPLERLPNLRVLSLHCCCHLQELPPLERLPNLRVLILDGCIKVRELGITGSVGGFPMLERLEIRFNERLESISSSSSNVVWTEGTMPKLQTLRIDRCPALKRLPIGIEKLSNLKELQIKKDVWDGLIWEDINVKICLKKRLMYREYVPSFNYLFGI